MVATRRTKAAASPKPPGPTRAASPTPNAAVLAAAAADDPSVADGAAAPDAAAPEEPDRTPGMLALWRALFYSLMCAQWYRGHIAHSSSTIRRRRATSARRVLRVRPVGGPRRDAPADGRGRAAAQGRQARLRRRGGGGAASGGGAFDAADIDRPLAVVYVFASLWKTHPDWVSGAVVRGIFLGFEEQGVHRGVPWAAMEATLGPRLFAAVALGGLLLDGSMAAALLCLRPSASFAAFAALSCAFHGFTCFTMSQRIGYAFPGACVCAVVLFAPVGGPGGDAPLHAWLAAAGFSAGEPRARRARPARPLRCLLLLYVLLQVLVPLRMPLLHGADFAMSARLPLRGR
ncbi:hypothetical protein JL722_13199 [Aureococcus anophagefferens]|nr:hypothetical protein JL722_13199 [Aureococcus anophagefferens]